MTKRFLLFILCIPSLLGYSQSPGGVGTTNLRGWFNAGLGVTITGGAVSTWTDQAGVGNATQTTPGERPTLNTASINYNPALSFDGNDDNLDLADRMTSGTTGVSAYAVAFQTATTGDTWGSIFNGQANGPSWTGGGYGLVALNVGSTQHGFYVMDYDTKGVAFPLTNGVPTLLSGTWNGTTANNVQAFKNGTSAGTIAYTPGSVGDNGSSWIGSGNGTNTNYCFYGNIAEIAIFNTGLNAANNNRVMSYFALKYGITMSTNYLNSAGSNIFTPSGLYVNNIIGISRDDNTSLLQKQSKTLDDTVRIYLSALSTTNGGNTGSFASNASHIVIGDNSGRMCGTPTANTDVPSGIVSRLEREWKVTNTNFGGTFSMDFKVNPCAIPGTINISNLRFIVDDDGNFTSGTTNSYASGSGGLTISYSNPIITVSGISTSFIPSGSTRYMTLGSISPSTPLPIELLNFTAKSILNKSVELMWQTASEINNDYFTIERSLNGTDWNNLFNVAGAGNTSTLQSYSTVDENPVGNLSYYRLKQTNVNGSFTYSNIVAINLNKNKENHLEIYPNPASNNIIIIGSENNLSNIKIFNTLGHDVTNFTKLYKQDDNSLLVDISNLSQGTYLIRTETTSSIVYKQ